MNMHKSLIGSVEQAEASRGASLMLEILRSEGVEYIFGNPGTTELPMIDALVDRPEIQYIWGLQEASVVGMADGYAQAAGRPGFVNLHTAGGLGHGLGNILNASVAGTPLVVTAGQQDQRHAVTDPLLYDNLVNIAAPAVKWAQEISTAAHLPILVRRAFYDCMAAPSGPVFLSLPMDVMEEMTTVGPGTPSHIDRKPIAGSLDRLADYLAAIAPGKTIIIAGDEIAMSDAADEVAAVAEFLGAPVYGSSWPARIPFPTNHPQWMGNLPTKASEISAKLGEFDCILALGGKSVITILYTEGPAVPGHCQVFQVTTDVRDLGRTYPTELSVVGDIKASLEVLLPLLQERLTDKAKAFGALRKQLVEASQARREQLFRDADDEFTASVTTPIVAARAVAQAAGEQVPIVDEAVATSRYLRGFLNSSSPRQYSFCRGGGLGWGMPAAVGFSLGIGREPVLSVVGDGAAMYSPQVLWTAAHEKLPVTFVVMNNREYNILKNFMRSQAHFRTTQSNRFIAMDINDPPVDFLALARSMGVQAQRVERACDIAGAIEAGIASGVPNVIEVPITAEVYER